MSNNVLGYVVAVIPGRLPNQFGKQMEFLAHRLLEPDNEVLDFITDADILGAIVFSDIEKAEHAVRALLGEIPMSVTIADSRKAKPAENLIAVAFGLTHYPERRAGREFGAPKRTGQVAIYPLGVDATIRLLPAIQAWDVEAELLPREEYDLSLMLMGEKCAKFTYQKVTTPTESAKERNV